MSVASPPNQLARLENQADKAWRDYYRISSQAHQAWLHYYELSLRLRQEKATRSAEAS